jgi:hypothetical protein
MQDNTAGLLGGALFSTAKEFCMATSDHQVSMLGVVPQIMLHTPSVCLPCGRQAATLLGAVDAMAVTVSVQVLMRSKALSPQHCAYALQVADSHWCTDADHVMLLPVPNYSNA